MVTNKKISLSKDKHNFYYHLAFYKSIYMCVHKQFQNKSARLLFRTPLLLLLSSLKHSQVKEKTAILLRSKFLERGNLLKMHKNSVLKEERQTF